MSLTNDDKVWISEQLGRFHLKVEALESKLEDLESRLELKFERFHSKLEEMDSKFGRFHSKIEEMDSKFGRFDLKLDELESKVEHVDVKLERVETALLTEFHKWASPVEMRVRSHSATLRALDLELESIANRVTKLEGPSGNNQAI